MKGFPAGASGKEPIYQCRSCKEMWVQSLGQEDPLEIGMKPTQETQIFFPGESHGQRSLAELRLFNTLSLFDMTEVT